ncbi:hypothetical protein JDV02_003976 [Purpureocillium takamizusanense]|uniref:Uncharacterized protein n=1 Tax=Purpureocillium takamizusanense TaxID=2060973 RepID=A0A9Q8QCR9_9HYPO|nr:uncharacterized protein JDV02_003976 [Purpureocillium takamizusanense]UNI17648.1 hypothetical protein JDV02_003976 [Purpureocillium takamizusanense]
MIACLKEASCGPGNSPLNNGRRRSQSQPDAPTKPPHRWGPRFRFHRPWDSPQAAKDSSGASTTGSRDPRERRRRARDSQDIGGSSDVTSSFGHSPLGGGGASPMLAMAAMILATEELDRLSRMARRTDADTKESDDAA